MVYTGKIDAESKAYVRFLREEGDLTVQEIVDLCGISRSCIYRCLNAKKCFQIKFTLELDTYLCPISFSDGLPY